MLLVAVAWYSSDSNAICYVLPVLWMTTDHFHIVEQMDQNEDDEYVSSSSPCDVSGAKVAVSDCIWLL